MLNLRKPLLVLGSICIGYLIVVLILCACMTKKKDEEVRELQILPATTQPILIIDNTNATVLTKETLDRSNAVTIIFQEQVDQLLNSCSENEVVVEEEEIQEEVLIEEEEVHPEVLLAEEPPVEHVGMSAVDMYLRENADLTNLSDDFLSLCSTIHFEAGIAATLESKVAVGHVVVNRLRDQSRWHYTTLHEAIYAPSQFNVVNIGAFETLKSTIKAGNWDKDIQTTVTAAYLVMTGSELFDIPDDVEFFYGDPNKRTWGTYTYCFTVGGNSYFK